MSQRKRCKECRTPLDEGAEYCGRCGAGVRQIPVGCAVVGLIAAIAAAVLIMRFIQSSIH